MLVFVAIPEAGLGEWARGGVLREATAFAATSAFCSAFGVDDPSDEDAERTLLYIAGLAGLLRDGVRTVAVAQAPSARPLPGPDEPLGAAGVPDLRYAAVTALFTDDPADPDASAALARARDALAGLGLADAWDHPAHEALLAEADLLWHGPAEWDALGD